MKRIELPFPFHSIIALICVLTLVAMGAFAIYSPPKGEISQSVLKFCWILVVVIIIFQIRPILEEVKTFSFTKGDMTISATSKDEDEEPTPSK